MKTDFQLPPEEQLNGDNFENWIVKINNALKARKLLKYVKAYSIQIKKEQF